MDTFEITGGYPLNGQMQLSGAKNVALKVLIASLLTKEEVIIENIPLISDLFLLVEIVKKLGIEVVIHEKEHIMIVKAENINSSQISHQSFSKLRVSFLLMIPLLLRTGEVKIPVSGGDNIGIRPIDRTINGLKTLGGNVDFCDGYYFGQVKKFKAAKYQFTKNTHTGTEAMILAASLAEGETILKNCSEEPEVDELIKFLNSMGAKIKRIKNRTIVVKGVRQLRGTKFKIMSDRNEAVTFAVAALLTKGQLEIFPVINSHLQAFYQKLKKTGAEFCYKNQTLFVDGRKRLLLATDIRTSPYPGFMTDWQAPWTLLMTQAEGISQVWETVFDKRFGYVPELLKMGAKIELFNPRVNNPEKFYNFNWQKDDKDFHAARIFGPTELKGRDLTIGDLRAGATLVLAALAAHGQSRLMGVEHIDRGYERFEERLGKLGAKIERVKI